MSTVTLNHEQRLFVIGTGGGFSCLGFDVVFKRLRQYAEKLKLTAPQAEAVGTLAQYEAYRQAESAYMATNPADTQFDPDTPLKVQALLEAYRKHGGRVRIFLGDTVTGRDWLDEHDVIGTIGRSMGPLKVPLLVGRGEHGGPALLTACIVRMVDAVSKLEVYRHPAYQAPSFTMQPSTTQGYPVEVLVNGSVHARFKSEAQAQRWIEFMQGTRMSK